MRQAIISTAMLMIASVPAESRSALRFGACPKPYFFPRSFESAALPRSFQKVSSTFFFGRRFVALGKRREVFGCERLFLEQKPRLSRAGRIIFRQLHA